MPRTLPWLTSTSSSKPTPPLPRAAPPQKKRRIAAPDSDSDSDSLPHSRGKKAVPQSGRDPSTSPPLPRSTYLPPAETPLIPGLSHDDIYIMVEDEFLATAHTFTRHLHQAEYQRLKQQIREKSRKRTDGNGIGEVVSRPTDGRTEMSALVRKVKEGREREGRLEGLKGKAGAGRRRAGSEGDDESGSEVEGNEGVEAGTALGNLIKRSALKGQMGSLVGLNGMRGNDTRTARRMDQRRITSTNDGGSRRENINNHHLNPAVRESLDESSSNSDDLDARPHTKSKHSLKSSTTTSKTPLPPPPRPKKPEPPPSSLSLAASDLFDPKSSSIAKDKSLSPTKHPTLAASATSKPSSASTGMVEKSSNDYGKGLRYNNKDDDNDVMGKSTGKLSSFAARRKQRRELEEKEKKANGGSRSMEVDEVPVFLV